MTSTTWTGKNQCDNMLNQLLETEKHEVASAIMRWTARQDSPPLTDDALVQVADALFVELDKMEAVDAEAKSRGSLIG